MLRLITVIQYVTPSQPVVHEDSFNPLIAHGLTYHQIIPTLNRSFLHNTATAKPQIVRFTGMVQDMLEPEYYLAEIHGVTTHFRDYHSTSTIQDMYICDNLAERQPLVVVPIPFVGTRLRVDYDDNIMPMEETVDTTDTTHRSNKRSIGQTIVKEQTSRPAPCSNNESFLLSTREDSSVNQNNEATAGTLIPQYDDWWPVGTLGSDPNNCPVLAKLYYEQTNTEDCRLKLNQVVELIGVLSMDPWEADFDNPDDSFGMNRLIIPPPSLLPRLHVLCVNHLKMEEINNDSITDDEKNNVLQLLTEQLGSATTSEAILMVLLSMAERNQDAHGTFIPVKTMSETTVGCASLNLIFPHEAACCAMQQTLECLLRQFIPVVASCSLADLGGTLVSPATTNVGRLTPSPLQLPRGATLLINEATLQAGPIGPRSQETLAALADVTRCHTVPYRFDGSMVYQWEADYRVIVLSVSNRNVASKLLPCVMQLVVQHGQTHPAPTLSSDAISVISSYLNKVRCASSKIVLNDVLEVAQRDFVERRVRARHAGMTECGEHDLHRWLTMTALQAKSRGVLEATVDDWNQALLLDEAMRTIKI